MILRQKSKVKANFIWWKAFSQEEIDNALHITSFIASAIGARGTPAVFINNEFNPGYVPKDIIEKILK